MNTLLILGLAVLLAGVVGHASAAADQQTPGTADRITIRVMSYNILHGADLEGVAKAIKAVRPDIVALQEVDNKTTRSNGVDQAMKLARLTGLKYVYGASMDFQGGQYGNAVLTTLVIKESKVIALPGEPRSALCLTLQVPAKRTKDDFLFIAIHLDRTQKARLASVELIEALFKPNPGRPAVLAGDFNATPGSPLLQALEKTWHNATNKKDFLTWPTGKLAKQIDYVMVRPSKHWKVVETKVLDEWKASDHYPILAVLEFVPESSSQEK